MVKYSKVLNQHYSRLSDRLKGSNNLHARRQLAQIQKMHAMVESLEKLAASRRPSETPEGHLLRIAEATRKIKAQRDAISETAHGILRDGVTDLDNAIASRVGLVEGKYAAEIRAAFRAMTPEQRSEALYQAAKSGDAETVAAITEAPSILSGVHDEVRTRTRELLENSKAPELVAQRADLFDSFDSVLASMSAVSKAAAEGFDPAKLAEIEKAEADHTERAQAFESALAGDAEAESN